MDEHEKLIKLAQSLVDHDESRECPFCAKRDWGAELHKVNCPFRMAYDIIEEEGANAWKNRKVQS